MGKKGKKDQKTERDVKKVIIDNLNTLLGARNQTQTWVAERLGVRQSTVSSWCNGVSMPSLQNLKSLSETFGVTVNWLLEDHRDSSNPLSTLYQKPNTYSDMFIQLLQYIDAGILTGTGIRDAVLTYLIDTLFELRTAVETGHMQEQKLNQWLLQVQKDFCCTAPTRWPGTTEMISEIIAAHTMPNRYDTYKVAAQAMSEYYDDLYPLWKSLYPDVIIDSPEDLPEE